MVGKAIGHVIKPAMGNVMGMHPYGWVLQILILAAVFLVVYWIIKSSRSESAVDIINKRYAKGEISRQEYLKLKEDIRWK